MQCIDGNFASCKIIEWKYEVSIIYISPLFVLLLWPIGLRARAGSY